MRNKIRVVCHVGSRPGPRTPQRATGGGSERVARWPDDDVTRDDAAGVHDDRLASRTLPDPGVPCRRTGADDGVPRCRREAVIATARARARDGVDQAARPEVRSSSRSQDRRRRRWSVRARHRSRAPASRLRRRHRLRPLPRDSTRARRGVQPQRRRGGARQARPPPRVSRHEQPDAPRSIEARGRQRRPTRPPRDHERGRAEDHRRRPGGARRARLRHRRRTPLRHRHARRPPPRARRRAPSGEPHARPRGDRMRDATGEQRTGRHSWQRRSIRRGAHLSRLPRRQGDDGVFRPRRGRRRHPRRRPRVNVR